MNEWDRRTGMGWIAGEDPAGHRLLANRLLDLIDVTCATATGLDDLPNAWMALEAAMESIAEGCRDEHASETRPLLTRLQKAYTFLATTQLGFIEREPGRAYDTAKVKPLSTSPYIAIRRRLEARFNAAIPDIHRWGDGCAVEFDEDSAGRWTVKDHARLAAEVARLRRTGPAFAARASRSR